MAKYFGETSELTVDLTKHDWRFGDDCEGMISVYPFVGIENVFEEIVGLEDDVYLYLNLHYKNNNDDLIFESLWIELDGYETIEISCSEKEVEMFNVLLKSLN